MATASKVEFPESAWRGLFAQYRDLTGPISEAPDSFHWAALCSAASAAIGRDCALPFGRSCMPPVVFTCTVTETGQKKSVAVGDVRDIVVTFIGKHIDKWRADRAERLAGAPVPMGPPSFDWLLGTGSGEGFAERVADREIKVPDQQKDDPKTFQTGRRCLYLVDELAMLLAKIRRDQAGNMEEFILKAYDAEENWNATTTRGRTIRITNGTAVFLTATNEENLLAKLSDEMIMNGLANRFLWFYPSGELKQPISLRPDVTDDRYVEPFRIRLNEYLRAVWEVGRFSFSPEAFQVHDQIYRENHTVKMDSAIGRAVSARTSTHAIRLSMIFAWADGTAVIRPEHVRAAWDVAKYSREVINDIGGRREAGSNKEADDRILNAIRRRVARQTAAGKTYPRRFQRKDIFHTLQGKHGMDSFTFSRSWNSLVENSAIQHRKYREGDEAFELGEIALPS